MVANRNQGARSLKHSSSPKNAANDLHYFTALQPCGGLSGIVTMRLVLALAALAAGISVVSAAPAGYDFVAAPDGDDNGECTAARPCSPQGAVNACPNGQVCDVQLQPGLYLDPEVNIYYHRTVG